MKYDPVKKSLGRLIKDSLFLRKLFYFLLDILLLRAWHVRKTLRKVAPHFQGKASVLDAGSGFGQYTWRLSRMNRRWTVTGIDINREHVADCNDFFRKAGLAGRVSFTAGDLTTMKDTDLYDLVLSVDVMEHIKEDEKVFSNLFLAMKNEGILIISTPSDKGGSDADDENSESFIEEHVRNGYSIGEIKGKLEKAGFSDVEASYTYGIPGNLSWKLSMKYPILMLNRSRFFFFLLPFYYIVFFPLSAILNTFDVCIDHKSGTGLIVTARKNPK